MSNYTQVSKGSSGDSVKDLQKILNQNGYSLAVDGVFGEKTLAAVKDYQKNNGLAVDGIVGSKTWSALTGAAKELFSNTGTGESATGGSTTGGSSTVELPNVLKNSGGYQYEDFTYDDFTYDDYVESDIVKNANAALQAHLATKPGAYESQWSGQIGSVLDQYMNREDFSYDVNSDALYQQYKDQYTTLGKLAMQDTMGQAAAMTGGYGSSYASTAGNQAYQSYLSQLNNVIPELYGMALDRYNMEGQELLNQYGLLSDQENQDYGRYIDSYNQWASETDRLQSVYNNERTFDYNKYNNERGFEYDKYSDNRNIDYNEHITKQNLGYQEYRNAIEDQQWQASLDESARQFDEQMAFTKQQYEDAKSSGGSSAALEHVSSMSSTELVDAMKAYNYDGDDQGLAAFLDDCVASGRLTEAQADNYYAQYRTGSETEGTDTTVEPTTSNKLTNQINNQMAITSDLMKNFRLFGDVSNNGAPSSKVLGGNFRDSILDLYN